MHPPKILTDRLTDRLTDHETEIDPIRGMS